MAVHVLYVQPVKKDMRSPLSFANPVISMMWLNTDREPQEIHYYRMILVLAAVRTKCTTEAILGKNMRGPPNISNLGDS